MHDECILIHRGSRSKCRVFDETRYYSMNVSSPPCCIIAIIVNIHITVQEFKENYHKNADYFILIYAQHTPTVLS